MNKPLTVFQSGDILFIPISPSTIFAFSLFSKKDFTLSAIPVWARALCATHLESSSEISDELKTIILQRYQQCVSQCT